MRKPSQIPEVRSPARAGFSLLEVFLVVCLVFVLMSLYWFKAMGISTKERNLKACAENLEKLYLSLAIYAHEHAGQFPVATNARTSEEVLDMLVPHYTSDTTIFTCPSGKAGPLRSNQSVRDGKISYAYYMGIHDADRKQPLLSDWQIDTRAKDIGEAVFSESGSAPANNHGKSGGNILFSDGHVELSPARAAFPLPAASPGVVLLNPKP